MNQFRVIIGRHIEPLGGREKRTYNKGEIVHSDKDLCALFAHKFEALGPVPEAVPPARSQVAPVEATDERVILASAEPVEADPPTKPARKVKTKKRADDWDDE